MISLRELLIVDNPEWAGPRVGQYLLANPTIFLTLIYVLVSGLGMLYEIILFSEFGINVLEYSEVADFFLAAFKNPGAFGTGFSIICSLVFYRIMANYARNHKNIFMKIAVLSFSFIGLLRREILIPFGIIYFVIIYGLFAQIDAKKLVYESDSVATISMRFGEIKDLEIIPIGATEKFYFGIEMTENFKKNRKTEKESKQSKTEKESIKPEVKAIPFSNIISIKYSPVEISS